MTSQTATALPSSSDYSPDHPYDVKGEWVRSDLLALMPKPVMPKHTQRVLSIGCGTGNTESMLQKQGAEVVGLDVSADAIATAKGRLHEARVADVESDPLADLEPGSFDVVMCGDVLEHLRFTEHVLQRIRGWLSDGGHLIVAVPNATHHSVLRTLVLRRDWKYEDDGLFDRGHYRLFTRKSLTRLLEQHGFEIEKVDRSLVMPRIVKWARFVFRPVFWLLPFLDEYLVYTWSLRVRKTS